MNNKHKWYDVIVAWASGEKIQVRNSKILNDKFTDFIGSNPSFDGEEWEWRIKPNTVTKKYRMALINYAVKEIIALDLSNYSLDFPAEREVHGFIRWVGDTVEIEVEV